MLPASAPLNELDSSTRLRSSQSRDPTSSRRRRARGKQAWQAFKYTDEQDSYHAERITSPLALYSSHLSQSLPRYVEHDASPLQLASLPSTTCHDDNSDLQLFIGRRNKSADQDSSGAVDMTAFHKIILETFGNAIPSEQSINSHPGTVNGQIQFVQGSPGTVMAYQWSFDSYQWVKLGLYSQADDTITGEVSGDDLKLPSTWSEADIEVLARFRLLGKQREARATNADFSDKQIKALMPGFKPTATPSKRDDPARHPTPQQVPHSSPLQTPQIIPTGAPTICTPMTYAVDNTPSSPAYTTAYEHNYTLQHPATWHYPPFVSYGAPPAYYTPTPLPPSMTAPFYSMSSGYYGSGLDQDSQHPPISGYGSQSVQCDAEQDSHLAPLGNYHAQPAQIPAEQNGHSAQIDAESHHTRSLLRSAVMRMPEQAVERTRSQADLKSMFAMTPGASLESNSGPRTIRRTVGASTTIDRFTPGSMSASSTSWYSSSSYTTHWQQRARGYLNGPISTEPTPQRFEGPFFPAERDTAHAVQTPMTAAEHDKRVNDWWWSDNNFSRQSDFYERLKATSGAPKSASGEEPTFDLGRLMVPVLENLTNYLNKPVGYKREYFRPWTPAPEWAIDRSATGNNSFFDPDWNPPARIGRDIRFHPTPPANRLYLTPATGLRDRPAHR